MNKLSLVLSLAAVAAVSGCLDPQYKSKRTATQEPTVVKPAVPSEPVEPVTPVDITPDPTPAVNIDVVDTPDPKPVEVKPVEKEAEYTTYIVQRGDTLSKISKRYNIKIDAIKANNPQIKNNVIRLGQKLKLPGKVDVGEQTVPVGAIASMPTKKASPAAAAVKKDAAPAKAYTGATKDYVVKNGDTLGGIAIASGLTVRQLKELNGLSKDMIRVGQKLKVPASKVEKKVAPVLTNQKVAEKKVDTVKPTQTTAEAPVVADGADKEEPAADTPAVETVSDPQPAAKTDAKYVNYTVQEGDDLFEIALREHLTVPELREINNLGPDDKVEPGMVIKIPAPAL
ncbi:MAG: LysM peptidoglycan-binding domain-containing protein [Kiritimatiellae bacterium]|nr:LysM peptidoglycan-binding domain-containing protein [Kiritimatiellia bacterium]